MCTKAKALAVARKFGLVLDERNSGLIGHCYTVILDHPTHSFSGDCRSITVSDYGSGDVTPAQAAWSEAIERMQSEAPFLEPCPVADCDYHSNESE